MNSKSHREISYLLIGPLPSSKLDSIGGTTISFQALVDYFKSNGYNCKIIITNKFTGPGKYFLNQVYVCFFCFFFIFKRDVIILNVNSRGAVYLTPIIYFLSFLMNKKLVVRIFGGNLIEYYMDSSKFEKHLLKSAFFKADLVLLQTKRLIHFFSSFSANNYWFPTSRKTKISLKGNRSYHKRFVYIGQIFKNKGMDELVRLKKELPNDYLLDIFGPILNKEYEFLKKESYYRGVLRPEEVNEVLNEYDVLLLPTYHQGEGYPGIVIEANQLAIPVISTNWLGIPELVRHNETGILVTPKSFTELIEAVLSLNEYNYTRLSSNACEWSKNFDMDVVNGNLIKRIDQLYE